MNGLSSKNKTSSDPQPCPHFKGVLDLVGTQKLSRMENWTTNFMRKLADQDFLIVDDWGMLKLEGEVLNEIEQIIDDRYGYKALIIASQLPVSDWYNIFQSELIAEICLALIDLYINR